MIYLSGAVRPELLRVPNTGFILTPMMGNRPDLTAVTWAADTGCFSKAVQYQHGRYITWLEERMAPYRATCLFATAPDVVGDAEATWVRSRPLLPLIRALGYPAALVAQDGIERLPIAWDAFDVLFIGGTTEWKLSRTVVELAADARAHDKRVHCGRVNSLTRLRRAKAMGCHSADGTFLAFGPDKNLPRVRNWMLWMEMLDRQPSLFTGAAEPEETLAPLEVTA